MRTYNTKIHIVALQSLKISHLLKEIQGMFPEDNLNSLILDKMKEIVKSKDIKNNKLFDWLIKEKDMISPITECR